MGPARGESVMGRTKNGRAQRKPGRNRPNCGPAKKVPDACETEAIARNRKRPTKLTSTNGKDKCDIGGVVERRHRHVGPEKVGGRKGARWGRGSKKKKTGRTQGGQKTLKSRTKKKAATGLNGGWTKRGSAEMKAHRG